MKMTEKRLDVISLISAFLALLLCVRELFVLPDPNPRRCPPVHLTGERFTPDWPEVALTEDDGLK